MEIGSAAHAVALEGNHGIASSYGGRSRTGERNRQGNAYRSAGAWPDRVTSKGIPSSRHDGRITQAAPPKEFIPEATIIWEERGVWYRARIDALSTGVIYDVKTTGLHATPEGWGRTQLWEYAMQVGFYRRAYAFDNGGELPGFRFIVQENSPPYEVGIFTLENEALNYCDGLAVKAMTIWGACMESGEWPGYPRGAYVAELPGWLRAKQEEAVMNRGKMSHERIIREELEEVNAELAAAKDVVRSAEGTVAQKSSP